MNDPESKSRISLAFLIALTSIAGVIVLSGVIVYATQPTTTQPAARSDAAMHVLGSVLPMIGTWVGTVLAFYFGKANFEAAGDLAKQLSPMEKLRQVAVREKMIPKDSIFLKVAPLELTTVSSILADMDRSNKGDRLPVVTTNLAAKYIIHRSMLNDYLSWKARSAPGTNVSSLTFGDLLNDRKDLSTLFETSFAFVSQDATLADARVSMERTRNCEDVFVTATGQPSEPLIGWVTDNIIQANLKT
ncbi:MAG TPA: hypothetical protein VFA15_08825 [Nitrososphaera sp.]|nr:hypothetical protein [Nitrososphaera sp.]